MTATTTRSPLENWRRQLGAIEFALERDGLLTEPSAPPTDAPTDRTEEITADELRAKLVRGDDFVLAMAMDRTRFRQAHIPGSIDGDSLITMAGGLDRDTEIVVYCTNAGCAASRVGAAMLREAGFTNVRRFAGGLTEWARAGLPIESGELGRAA